jgi:hypothetical protein
MSLTNFDGFNYINTILRKELNGSPITIDKFNTSLKTKFIQKLNDEYIKFEKNQSSTDALQRLKKTQTVNFDGNSKFNLSDLIYNYWHLISCSYSYNDQFIDIDIVTENEWNNRMKSTLEQPTYYYPIIKVFNNYLYIYPYVITTTGANKVANAGTSETTDWVDSNSDDVADDWVVLGGLNPEIFTGYGFDGRSQAIAFYNSGYVSGDPEYSAMYYAVFYYTAGGDNLISGKRYIITFDARVIAINDDYTGDLIVTISAKNAKKKLKVIEDFNEKLGVNTYTCLVEIGPDNNEPFFLIAYNTTLNYNKYVAIDKVSVYEVSDFYNINIDYFKEANTPYFDWYYDSNDNIQYLEEGEIYTLQTGESYIDKDDGTVYTSGSVIGTSTDDAINHTIEMEVPDDIKKDVFYSMLSDFGISLNNQLSAQYSIGLESKELNK